MSFRGPSGSQLDYKRWHRDFEIPLIVPGLKVKWNDFDEVVLNAIHYNPTTRQYLAEYYCSFMVGQDDNLKSSVEFHNERMLHGGWSEYP